jgi:TRAP transporter TAXI family solute receptor
VSARVVAVGGADATLRAIGDKKSELGMVHTWALYKAFAGAPPFDKKLDVRTLLTGQETGNCLIARADRGIKSPADLAGKTIVGERPALKSVDEYTYALLDLYGIKGKVKVISTAETREAMQALQQGTVDAVVLPCGLRAPHITELMESVASVTVDIPDDKMKELLAKTTPGAITGTNPPNTYKGQVNPYTIPVYQTVLVSSADLSEDAVYRITKAIVEKQDALVAAHPTGRAWTLENTLRGTNFAVPFHPGAVKYFKERGVWKDAHEETQKRLLSK